MSDQPQNEANLIICDMSVFTDEQRNHHMQLAQNLLTKVTEIKESENGYALRLPDENDIILKMAEFINDDRRCCQFIRFGIDIEAYGQGIWLTLKGNTPEAKAAIQSELLGLVHDNVTEKQN